MAHQTVSSGGVVSFRIMSVIHVLVQCYELLGCTAAELGRSNRAAVEERRDGLHLAVSPEVLC